MTNKIKVAVGSTNPTKTRAVENVLRVLFSEVEMIVMEVPSGIAAIVTLSR